MNNSTHPKVYRPYMRRLEMSLKVAISLRLVTDTVLFFAVSDTVLVDEPEPVELENQPVRFTETSLDLPSFAEVSGN